MTIENTKAWRPDVAQRALCVCGWTARRPSYKAMDLAVRVHLAHAGTGGDHAVDRWSA